MKNKYLDENSRLKKCNEFSQVILENAQTKIGLFFVLFFDNLIVSKYRVKKQTICHPMEEKVKSWGLII